MFNLCALEEKKIKKFQSLQILINSNKLENSCLFIKTIGKHK